MDGENTGATEGVSTDQIQFNKTDFLEERRVNDEKTASKHGWVDLDAYIENGGDPDDWIDAGRFNDKGVAIKSSIKQKSNHDKKLTQALKDVNEVHKTQLDIKLADLIKQRDIAIEGGEKDKVTEIDGDIDQTKEGINKIKNASMVVDQVPDEHIEHEKQWSQDNPWFNEQNPKGAFARELANQALTNDYHGEDLTNHIENEISKAFPLKNENRNKPGMSDKGSKKSQSKGALTMDSLTNEENRIVQSLMNNGKSEEDCLRMVKSSRA